MASTDAFPVPRKNTAFRYYFALRDPTTSELITSWTGQDSEVSKDGGAFSDCTNEATEIGSSGCGYIELTSTEMNADNVILKITVTNTNAVPYVVVFYPEEAGDYRADMVLLSGDSLAADNLESACDGTGYFVSAPSEFYGTAQAGSSSSLTLKSATTLATSSIVNRTLEIVGGTGAGQTSYITAYDSGTKVATVAGWTITPDNTSIYRIGGYLQVNMLYLYSNATAANNLQTAYASTSTPVVGSVTGAVGSVTGAVGSVTGNVGGNVTGSVGSVVGAVGSVTGNVGGNVTGSVGSLATQAKADVNAEVDAALVDIHLDHLLATDYDPASKPGTSTALLNELVENDGGVSRYTANALEQAPTGSGATAAAIADAVWEELIADHSGTSGSTAEALNAAGSAGDPWVTALPGSYTSGQAGKIIGDNINATISSRSSHSAADVWAVGTRTLTSFGTLVADVWAYATRILTAATNITSTGGTTVPQTGDAFARIGAPAGASASADIAAIKSQTAAIETDTQDIQTTLAALNNLSAAQVNAEVVDALSVDTYAEPGQGAPSATTTLAAKIGYLYKSWRNKKTQTSTTTNIFADDGTTVDQKATVSDDGTTFTSGEVASGP